MRNLRIAVLVSGSGRTLQNFIDLSRAGQLPGTVELVIGNKYGLKGIDRAVAADVATSVIDRKSFDDVAGFSSTIFQLCDGYRIDLVLLAGWLCLLRIPAMWEGRVMNIHPALLPSFGGKGMWGHHVHEAVINTGCKVSGCTVHFVNNDYDAGPIILQRTCPVLDADTADTLADRVFEEEKLAYPEAVRLYAAGKLRIAGRRVLGA